MGTSLIWSQGIFRYLAMYRTDYLGSVHFINNNIDVDTVGWFTFEDIKFWEFLCRLLHNLENTKFYSWNCKIF